MHTVGVMAGSRKVLINNRLGNSLRAYLSPHRGSVSGTVSSFHLVFIALEPGLIDSKGAS